MALQEIAWAWIAGATGTKLAGSSSITTARSGTGLYTATLTDGKQYSHAQVTHFTQIVAIPEGLQVVVTSPTLATINVRNRVNGLSDADFLIRLFAHADPPPASVTTDGVMTAALAAVVQAAPTLTIPSATSTVADIVKLPTQTVTITGTTAITTAAGFNYATIQAPTYTDVSAVTITNAATLVVTAAPIAAGSVTITNKYTLWVQAGDSRFDGIIRGLGTGGTRVFSQTNATTDHGYLILDDGSGLNLGFTAGSGLSTDGATLTIRSSSGASVIQTTADNTKFLNAAATEAARFTVNLNLLLGTTTDVATSKLRISASKTVASATSAVWDGVDHIASTLTISGATAITTATGVNANVFRQPTLSAASALTVTNAATVYIENQPTGAGAGPATITNAYALWVDNGAVRLDGNVGFFATAPAAQQTSGANLINNVTTGGTNNQIDDFTSLTVYATDAAAIRNDIFQLARKLKQINDGLRSFGLFT